MGTVERRSSTQQVILRLAALVLMTLLVAACAARLAPPYDPSLVGGLAAANKDALTLFAKVANGVSPGSFPQRSDDYDEAIGAFDALRLEAAARPVPQSRLSARLAGRAGTGAGVEVDDIARLSNPTPEFLTQVVAILTRMRDTDRRRGLSPVFVTGFKNDYEIAIEQALVFEKALQR
jgi:hypothetical protein